MQVRMKRTVDGSPDGIHIERYEQGKVYNIPESLYDIFNDQMGVVELVPKEEKPKVKEAHKEEPHAPENKEDVPKDKKVKKENKE